MKKILVLSILLVLVAVGAVAYWNRSAEPAASFRTVPVKRGDLVVTISATGTVEPEEVVDVGAQIAGRIASFGRDLHAPDKTIDYGSEVEQGTVLARIDDSLYAADVAQNAAQLEQAKANVARAQADLEQSRAKLYQAEQNWKRAQELGPSRALSATDYESYQANYETARATLAVGEATVVQTEKAVVQAQAALDRAKTNLGYCTITSPVKGVIIDRRVNIGQTVVASLNAPSVFLIAKDLRRIQVWASVNEADIGRIRPGQSVRFTVDAYPGQSFRGEVGKVRLNASMTQNVVTYTVEINTDNSDGKLLPYLTANVEFEVSRQADVLLVPNAALRWTPATAMVAPDIRSEGGGGGRPRPTGSRPAKTRAASAVWIVDGAYVRPVTVEAGQSDGQMTEVQGENLKEGLDIVVGENARGGGGEQTTNPFLPQVFRNRGQSPQQPQRP